MKKLVIFGFVMVSALLQGVFVTEQDFYDLRSELLRQAPKEGERVGVARRGFVAGGAGEGEVLSGVVYKKKLTPRLLLKNLIFLNYIGANWHDLETDANLVLGKKTASGAVFAANCQDRKKVLKISYFLFLDLNYLLSSCLSELQSDSTRIASRGINHDLFFTLKQFKDLDSLGFEDEVAASLSSTINDLVEAESVEAFRAFWQVQIVGLYQRALVQLIHRYKIREFELHEAALLSLVDEPVAVAEIFGITRYSWGVGIEARALDFDRRMRQLCFLHSELKTTIDRHLASSAMRAADVAHLQQEMKELEQLIVGLRQSVVDCDKKTKTIVRFRSYHEGFEPEGAHDSSRAAVGRYDFVLDAFLKSAGITPEWRGRRLHHE
ncbi:hypothetical protein FJ366_01535 [Candidatus Dependentiae bacterium]|nr:hypothetical protein [Candidatus Dependentiae bacterium]